MNVPTGTSIPDRNGKPLFDTGDGDIELWINGECFETHKYLIKRFAGLRDLLLKQTPGEALRVHAEGYDTDDFRRMFKVLYASILEGPFKFDNTTLVSALRIATVYGYPTLRAYTISHLEVVQLTAIERIKLAREFRLESWEEPAYLELCNRNEAITLQEATVLGLDAFVHVAGIREREQRRRGKKDAWMITPSLFAFRANATQPLTYGLSDTSTGVGTQNKTQASTLGQHTNSAFGASTLGSGSGTTGGTFMTPSITGCLGTVDNVIGASPEAKPSLASIAATPTGTAAGGLFGAAKPAGGIFRSTTTAPSIPTTGRGTVSSAYAAMQGRESAAGGESNTLEYQSITAMPAYRNFSFEELRAQDYAAGRRNPTSTGLGQTSVFGITSTTTRATGLFGRPATACSPIQVEVRLMLDALRGLRIGA